MPLAPLVPLDTRRFFRPVSSSLVALLRRLADDDWQRPTIAGDWTVRDVVAHLLDTACRRLSFHRDGMPPPPPSRAIASERDFVAFINDLNAQWVTAARRLSPRVLTDVYERTSLDLADWIESVPFAAPALFPVSWAGEQTSAGWFDLGREFTELWHHQQQVRMAVRADSLADPRYLGAVIDVAVRGLPHAFRDVVAERGQTVAIEVTGASGGHWTLSREDERWTIARGTPSAPTTHVRLDADAAWKLLFNALSASDAARAVQVEGRAELAGPLLRARSVVV